MFNAKFLGSLVSHTVYSRLFAILFASITLVGCGLTTTRIDATDNHTFLPALRMGVNLNESKYAPSEPQTGQAIEFGVTKATGSGPQSLLAGQQPVILDNTTFTPPQEVTNEFDFYFSDLSWRWRKFFNERSLGLDVSAGLGYTSLGLSVSSQTQKATQNFATWGPQGGVGLIWRFRSGTSLQARATGFASSADQGVTGLSRYELYLSQAILDNFSLRAGYADWNVSGQNQPLMSNFRLQFSGPVVALDLSFDNSEY